MSTRTLVEIVIGAATLVLVFVLAGGYGGEQEINSRLTDRLANCSAAYFAQKSVSDDLRSEASDGFDILTEYATSFEADTSDLDAATDAIAARVGRINAREAAIDSSACR